MVSWIWIPVSILIVALAALLPVAVRLYEFALVRSADRALAYRGLDLADYKPSGADGDPADWAAAHAAEDWTQQTPDGLRLVAWHFPAPAPSGRWAVLVHGYTANAEMTFPWAKRFHDRGFHVLAVDCRAHGRSGGNAIGMGWPDRRDLAGWTRMIADRDPGARIVLYGVSMGAATVMMATGTRTLSPAVACGVEDCGYTTVYAEFAHRMRHLFHVPTFPLLPLAGLVCLFRNGYSFFNASSLRQLRKSRLPMMFIHGQEDSYVPFGMVQKLYTAAQCQKELYTVPGAGHALSSAVDPEYWDKVFAFIDNHMTEGKPA